MIEKELREKILSAFEQQGFKFNPHVRPPEHDKETYKLLQLQSKKEQLQLHKSFIYENLKKVKNHLRCGTEINPNNISLELREVKENSLEEQLFRWWNFVWWSVPYQRTYGRQLRFVIWDKAHDCPFGLVSLQSPILKLSVRDNYLDLPKADLDIWVNQSMQAQRLGALPPYNNLIGSKMAALSVVSNEIRTAYEEKYRSSVTLLRNRNLTPRLLFITTTSAFGKSSVYNRLKYRDQLVAKSIGYTQGSGTFHIPESLYREILTYLQANGVSTGTTFGNGPSRKIKLIDKACIFLGIRHGIYHNIKREFFLFPLASNLHEVVKQQAEPLFYDWRFDDLFEFWKERWCLPRAASDSRWQSFDANNFVSETFTNYFAK